MSNRYFLFSEVQPQPGYISEDMFCFAEHENREMAYEDASKFVAESVINVRVNIGVGDDEESARNYIIDSVWSEWPYDQDQIDEAVAKWVDESPCPNAGASIVRYFRGIRTYEEVISPFEVQIMQNGYKENIPVERYLDK